jgi:hypothetical protein
MGHFHPTWRFRLATELTHNEGGERTVSKVRFPISCRIEYNRWLRYEIDQGKGFGWIEYPVNKIYLVGPLIVNRKSII